MLLLTFLLPSVHIHMHTLPYIRVQYITLQHIAVAHSTVEYQYSIKQHLALQSVTPHYNALISCIPYTYMALHK